MEYLHKRYGVLPWKELLEPAIKVARYGFPVTADLVRMMGYTFTKSDFLTADPNWAVDFAPNGTLLGLGDTMTRKRYADTLETIAEFGADAFYEGKMAEDMVEMVRAHNGTLTLEDFRDYKVEVREPVNIQYRGYNITSTGAPSSGSVVLAALKTLEGYEDFGSRNVNLSTHRLDEAIRFAYGEVSLHPFIHPSMSPPSGSNRSV
jgi:gamma-glutamyltranspeptidase / glutathione hydrolase